MAKKVFELEPKLTNYASPGGDDMAAFERTVYARYLEYMKEHHEALIPLTFPQFLLSDVKSTGYDSFLWPKDTLVKIRSNGMIGIVTGWTDVGVSAPITAVRVRTAKNEGKGGGFYPADLEKADIPPEVLEYVAGTLKDKVHGKVDEAFGGDGDGR